ncbi:MAG: glycosyltransferase family 2 protein [Cellvibrionaceae bacterium]
MTTVIIPTYKAKNQILDVIKRIPNSVNEIIIVDDACPEKTGNHIEDTCQDSRIKVIYHSQNKGVGGAMVTGYKEAMKGDGEYFVKIDSDGQMNPEEIERFIKPLKEGKSDYTKGNRFYSLEMLSGMPRIRIFGNAVLSFASKASSGYWDIMDPTNGYTAIHRKVLQRVPLDKLSNRYFFESDMLFRLNLCRAKVTDIPLQSTYGDEESNLKIRDILLDFMKNHISRIYKRLFYNYILRDFNAGSFFLLASLITILGGLVYGGSHWVTNLSNGNETPTGTIVITSILLITGFNFLINFFNYDTTNKPTDPIHPLL